MRAIIGILPVYTELAMNTEKQIREMISQINRHARDSSRYTGIPDFSPNILNAMSGVPRHEFIPESCRASAYEDSPLPVGFGQTISQPFIVALMVEVLKCKDTDRVLEIGAGCGYHAAVLSKLVREVYTVEIVEELAWIATRNLEKYKNAEVRKSNGYYGWREKAPFDAISVAAASDQIPEPLLEQLSPGGRMVLPLTNINSQSQSLVLVTKRMNGTIYRSDILPVIFVPFVKP